MVSNFHYSVPTPKPADVENASEFSELRARKHLNKIASFGEKDTGSVANEIHVPQYILSVLREIQKGAAPHFSMVVDIQRPSGSFFLDFISGFTK